MTVKLGLAFVLSFILGVLAVLVDTVAGAQRLPGLVGIIVPLLTLGLAPLPGVAMLRPKQLGKALLVAGALQGAVIVGATVAASLTTGPSFGNSLAFMILYGAFEFFIITVPTIAALRRLFTAREAI
jgi:hypothetical protein